MFGTVLTFAAALLHVYVFWRAASVPAVVRRVGRRWIWAAGGLLLAGFALTRFRGHGGTGIWPQGLELASMSWLAALFLAAVCLLVVDLVTGFGFLLPRLAPRLRGWALAAGAALTVLALVQGLRPPVVEPYDVRLPGLPRELDGTVIVALSDLHVGSILGVPWLEARVEQVAAENPDLVVLLGDILEGHGEPKADIFPALGRLRAPMGVWAVLGNHEYHGGDGDTAVFDGAAIRVMRDEWAEVRPGLVLAGVDDLTNGRRNGTDGRSIEKALADRPPGGTVLLSHTPWQAEKAAASGAGLMLSGHTHGGQIWPFGYLVARRYPLLDGRYDVDGMTVLVCRGTGTWGPRMRLWHPGAILRVTLRAG
jgi:predicted MPP superfamily phosphohydrolase